jgi:ABC-type nitrate/sulfonate/bicarbonate transport system substrate-binding protein
MSDAPPVRMLASIISHMPLHFVWQESGVCQAEGIALEVDVADVSLNGSPPTPLRDRAERLLDGTYQFLSGLHHEPYQARAKGDPRLTFVAQAQNDWDDKLVARADITGPRDLEGTTVFLSSRARCTLGNLKGILRGYGVDTESIRFVFPEVRTPLACREAVEALAAGDIDAALVDPPFDHVAKRSGARVLPITSVPVIHNATICADISWATTNRASTVAFLRSMVRAIHFFKTQPEAVVKILEEHLAEVIGIEEREDLYRLQEDWAGLLSPRPFPHPLAVWNVYQLEVAKDEETNFITPLEVWDLQFLREVDDSGLAAELYGSGEPVRNPGVSPQIFR